MQKSIRVSGFLYHPRSQQILLKQVLNTESAWSLFEVDIKGKQNPEEAFRKRICMDLQIQLNPDAIFSIYSYEDNHIFYAEIDKLQEFPSTKKTTFSWFNFKQVQKLHLPEQIKHDITVGQRVIDSAIRKNLGERTIG